LKRYLLKVIEVISVRIILGVQVSLAIDGLKLTSLSFNIIPINYSIIFSSGISIIKIDYSISDIGSFESCSA